MGGHFQGRGLRAGLILLAGIIGGDIAISRAADDPGTPWADHVRTAAETLAEGDWVRLEAEIEALEAQEPGHPLPVYLRARLAEEALDWYGALDHYRRVIALGENYAGEAWERLAAGRWVRASQALNRSRAAAVLAQSERVEAKPGRCLILPLEPIWLGPGAQGAGPDLEALGIAAAHWIVMSLSQIPGAEPVDLPLVLELQRAMAPGARPAVRIQAAEDPLPPVTTILGIASRLAQLVPKHPAPGSGDEAAAHYLMSTPTGEWSQTLARALAHFQSEYGLSASGVADPQTRRLLEEAHQAHTRILGTAMPRRELSDPTREMARLLGAGSLLTGTLQAEDDEAIRWNVAWIATADGSLIAPPLAGSLPKHQFRVAWGHLLDRIMVSSQLCTPGVDCLPAQISPTLIRRGAEDYGRALMLVDEDEGAPAAAFFAEAAAQGAGQWASWFAMAWREDALSLAALERERFEREIYGPQLLSPGLLRSEGLALSGGMVGAHAPLGTPRDPGISYAPKTGWLRVAGRIVTP